MIFEAPTERGFGKVGAAFVLACVVLAVIVVLFGHALRRYVRESLMQRVTSAHYQVLCPAGALSQEAMTQFATQREMLFVAVDQKLNDAASNSEIRVIFDPDFKPGAASSGAAQTYEVRGATVRTGLRGRFRNSIRRRTRRRCCMWPGASRGVRSSLIGRRCG